MPKLVAQRQLMISLRDAEVEQSMSRTSPPAIKEENRLSWIQRVRIPQENAKTKKKYSLTSNFTSSWPCPVPSALESQHGSSAHYRQTASFIAECEPDRCILYSQ